MTARPATAILGLHRAWGCCAYRLAQAAAFARPQHAPAIPDDLARHFLPGAERRFRDLSPADQRHLLATAGMLRDEGAPDDVLAAGLLHDLGKAYSGHRVRLLDRGLWVFGARLAPIARSFRNRPAPPRFGGGLWIAAHHADLGASIVRDLGYHERVCSLVAQHEDDALEQRDPGLAQLQAADNARHTIPARGSTELPGHPQPVPILIRRCGLSIALVASVAIALSHHQSVAQQPPARSPISSSEAPDAR